MTILTCPQRYTCVVASYQHEQKYGDDLPVYESPPLEQLPELPEGSLVHLCKADISRISLRKQYLRTANCGGIRYQCS